MSTARVAFVTQEATPEGRPADHAARTVLESRGVDISIKAWEDSSVPWEEFDAVVIRSPWNYHLKSDAFSAWLSDLERRKARVWNPVSVLRWNMHKRYLAELEAKGVPVVPTHWLNRGDQTDLAHLLKDRGWSEAVVKPAISAGAFDTFRVTAQGAVAHQASFAALCAKGEVMVQPFLPEILQGEWALLFFGGKYCDAVLKRPKAGDYRVQEEHGGYAERLPAPQGSIEIAQRALSAVSGDLLYARVDGCMLEGIFHLMELEVLEPDLFFGCAPQALEAYTDALLSRLASHS